MIEAGEICRREDMLSSLDEFYNLYLCRPIKNNDGGMRSAHMFHAWLILKKLQPATIIESGVWKGQGTWLFEQASPKSKIISIDPNPKFREYTSDEAKYTSQDFWLLITGQIT